LFIRVCGQNNGVLSASKRKRHFPLLTDNEIAQMQQVIREAQLE
jgi:hypothetical protein